MGKGAAMPLDDLEAAAVDLTDTAGLLVAAVIGDENVLDRGYALVEVGGRVDEIRICLVPTPRFKGLVIGPKGNTALLYRQLVADRAKVLDLNVKTDFRVVENRASAPNGTSWLDRD